MTRLVKILLIVFFVIPFLLSLFYLGRMFYDSKKLKDFEGRQMERHVECVVSCGQKKVTEGYEASEARDICTDECTNLLKKELK